MTNNDLTFIDTDELLSELARRSHAHLYIACKDDSNTLSSITFETVGLFPTCYGLARLSVDFLKEELRNSSDG